MTTACDLPIDLSTKSQPHHHHGHHHDHHHHLAHMSHLNLGHLSSTLASHHHGLAAAHPHHLHHLGHHHQLAIDHDQLQQLQLEYLSHQQLSAALAIHPLNRLYAVSQHHRFSHQLDQQLEQLELQLAHPFLLSAASVGSAASQTNSSAGNGATTAGSRQPDNLSTASDRQQSAAAAANGTEASTANNDARNRSTHNSQLELSQHANHLRQQLQMSEAANGANHHHSHHLSLNLTSVSAATGAHHLNGIHHHPLAHHGAHLPLGLSNHLTSLHHHHHHHHSLGPHNLGLNHHHHQLHDLATNPSALSTGSLGSTSSSSASSTSSAASTSSISNGDANQLSPRGDHPDNNHDHHHHHSHLHELHLHHRPQSVSPPSHPQLSPTHDHHHHQLGHHAALHGHRRSEQETDDNPSPIDLHRSSTSSTLSTVSSPSSSSASITSTSSSILNLHLTDKKRINRPLTGKHVKHGPGAGIQTLLALRKVIMRRQPVVSVK